MEKELLLTKSNFKKNVGTSVGLFLLMSLASMMIGLALLLFLDAYPTAKKEAERLDAGDGYLLLMDQVSEMEDDYIAEVLGDDVDQYDIFRCLAYPSISIPFGDGTTAPLLLVEDKEAFARSLNRTEVIEEDASVVGPYVYLPYQFFTSGGYEMGDTYSFKMQGYKYDFTVKGFLNTTAFGCNNTGAYEFVFDDDSYALITERATAAQDTILVSYDLHDGVKASKFNIRVTEEVVAAYPYASVSLLTIDEIISGKTFMSLILAVSFLTITFIIVLVITFMLTSCIGNYIKENMKTIGALKALGYQSKSISGSLLWMFELLAIFGSLLGVVLSYTLMPVMAQIVVGQMGLPYEISFNVVASATPVAVIVAFVAIVTVLSTLKIKKIEPIIALRDGSPNHNFRKNRVALDRSVFSLNVSLALKTVFVNIKQNIITFFATGLLIFICVVSLLMYENFNRNPNLGILTFETCGGVVTVDHAVSEDVEAYLNDREDATNIRRITNVKLDYNGEDRLYSYVMDDVDKMNNKQICYKGRLPKYDNEVAVSGGFAADYGLVVGDALTLDYGDKSYEYLITGLIQTCNNYGRELVMSEDAAMQVLDLSTAPGYYWFDSEDRESVQEILDAVTDQYGDSVLTTMNFYKILEGNMTTFKSISTLMLAVVCSISAVIIVLILYLLIKAFIYNKRKDYGIYKALGYTSNSLILQTSLSFMPTIVISVIVFSIVSYYAANPYMSVVMRSFGLMKCNFPIPVGGVVIIGVGMVAIAFLFSLFHARRVKYIEAYNLLTDM